MVVNSPSNLQPTLEDIKNQITMGEGEVRRLRNLKQAQEYEIGELLKAKQWHEEETGRLLSESEKLTAEVESRKQEIKSADKLVSEAEATKALHAKRELEIAEKLESSIRAIEKQRTDKLAELDSRECIIAQKEEELAIAMSEGESKSATLHKKLSDLKSAIENVDQEL